MPLADISMSLRLLTPMLLSEIQASLTSFSDYFASSMREMWSSEHGSLGRDEGPVPSPSRKPGEGRLGRPASKFSDHPDRCAFTTLCLSRGI